MKVPRKLRKPIASLRRMARTNTVRVPALCVLFVAGVVAAITVTREPEAAPPPRTFTMGWDGVVTSDGSDNDPAGQFAQRRVGRLLIATTGSDNCRRVLFHNNTGKSYQAGEVPCGPTADESSAVSGADRIQALRKSFQKEKAAP